jgi:poly(3-hydroxybutyrate) depolymerase
VLYVPPRVESAPPLMLLFHGTYGVGSDMLSPDRPIGFEDVADANGIVMVAPSARAITAGDWDQHWDGESDRTYWETYPRDDPSRGSDPNRNPDLVFVRALIEELRRTQHIDSRRIYTVGHSNGGFFSLLVATALRANIAAFVENSAGLVQCNDTADCAFQGSGTTCDALRRESGYCQCSGAEKPVALPTSGRMPPGLLSHSNDDNIVSVAYTCQLAARMTSLGHESTVRVRDKIGGHFIPDTLAREAWSFFSSRRLP